MAYSLSKLQKFYCLYLMTGNFPTADWPYRQFNVKALQQNFIPPKNNAN